MDRIPFDPARPALRTTITYHLNRQEVTALIRHWYARPDYEPGEHSLLQQRLTRLTDPADRAQIVDFRAGGADPGAYVLLLGIAQDGHIPFGTYRIDLAR